MKIETVLINNQEYYVLEKIILDGKVYYILINVDNKEDMCIRKKIIEFDEEYLVGLDNEEEFNKILEEYRRKN